MKSDMFKIIEKFNKLIENYFHTKIKTIYTNGNGEYRALSHLLTQHGIQHLISPLYTLEHVSSTERKHRHIVQTGLTHLQNVAIPLCFLVTCFLMCHLSN